MRQPPSRVEPGWIHRKLAVTILRQIQTISATKLGAPISVGDLPTPDPATGAIEGDETREPVELLARILAHVGHRVPGVKKIEKRLEGNDNRSGLGSDFAALMSQLFSRNEAVAYAVAEGMAGEAIKNVMKKPTAQSQPETPAFWEQDKTQDEGDSHEVK